MTGIVLEGGGGKGAYQIGACKALTENGYVFDAVAGTSVGALNGAAIAQGDVDMAYKVWHNMDPEMVYKGNRALKNDIKKASNSKDMISLIRRFRGIMEERGLDITPLKEMLANLIDEKKIRERNVILGIVTVSLSELKPLEIYLDQIEEGKLVDYLVASAYFPAFKLNRIDGKFYIDGGFYNNMPINLLAQRGVEDIVVIRTFGIGMQRKFNDENVNVIYIEPKERLSAVLDFSKESARYNLKLGYYDALKVIKKLNGTRYYLENDIDSNFFKKRLVEFDQESLSYIAKQFGMPNANPDRFLFEVLIPRITEFMGMKIEDSYEDLFINVLELIAQKLDIERFIIYKLSSFIDLVVMEISRLEEEKSLEMIPGFIARNVVLPKNIKERLLIEIARVLLGGKQ